MGSMEAVALAVEYQLHHQQCLEVVTYGEHEWEGKEF